MKILLPLLLLLITLGPKGSEAHSEPDEDTAKTAELYSTLLRAVTDLESKPINEAKGPQPIVRLKKLFFKNQVIDLNQNGFWIIAGAITDLYLKELKLSCEECKLPSRDDVLKSVDAVIAQSWTSKLGIGAGDIVVERYGLEFAHLAYRYGFVAGMVKVIGEIVEDALLVVFKMPNAHFLCEVITYYIALYSKAVNTTLRGLSQPRFYNNSRMVALARSLATSYVIKRALKKLEIEVPSFTVRSDALATFLSENEETRMSDRIIDYAEHKLENRNFTSASESLEKALNSRHRFNKFIQKLDRAMTKLRARLDGKNLSPEERAIAEEDLKVSLKIKKKIFEGKRYKRFLFLKKRRKAHSLGEFTQSSDILAGSEFWFFSLKNELLMPNLDFTSMKRFNTPVRERDTLVDWQIRSHDIPDQSDILAQTLITISSILDSTKNRKERMLDFTFLNSMLTEVLPKISSNLVAHRLNELDFNKSSIRSAAKIWKIKFKIYKRLSQFSKRLDIFSDLIRYGAVNSKTTDVTMPLHAREYYIELLKVFGSISAFSKVTSTNDIESFLDKIDKELTALDSNKYWSKKKNRSFSLKSLTGVYSCKALY